ncbi:unknown [Alistipes putredinis CAG:67]|nr:unknown [Alistipes putredinis CAG:67]
MFDAVPVEFPDRRTDAFRSAVAAVIVGQYGNVHAQGVECLGQSRRGAEAGVTRIGSGFGKGGFEIDDRCIGRTEALPHPVERGVEIEIAFRRTRRRELGRMLHQVPGEDQPSTPYLRERWRGRHVDLGCPAPTRQRVGTTDVKGADRRQSDDRRNDDFRKFLHFPPKIRYEAELSKKLRRFASASMGAFRNIDCHE